jgi:hypothetical protein
MQQQRQEQARQAQREKERSMHLLAQQQHHHRASKRATWFQQQEQRWKSLSDETENEAELPSAVAASDGLRTAKGAVAAAGSVDSLAEAVLLNAAFTLEFAPSGDASERKAEGAAGEGEAGALPPAAAAAGARSAASSAAPRAIPSLLSLVGAGPAGPHFERMVLEAELRRAQKKQVFASLSLSPSSSRRPACACVVSCCAFLHGS